MKNLRADGTFEPTFDFMLQEMLVQITFLRVSMVTTLNRTLERLFFRVDSYMIKQIMPFLKLFSTIWIIANKHLTPPITFRIVNSEESVGLNVRDVYRRVKVGSINIGSLFYLNNCIRYVLFVFDFIDNILSATNFVVI